MTISSPVSRVDCPGNGSATVFSFSPAVITQASDLEVWLIDNNGNQTVVYPGLGPTNYAIVTPFTYPGTGSISYPGSGGTVLPSGWKLVIKQQALLLQQFNPQNQGPFLAGAYMGAFDYHTLNLQHLAEEVSRSIQIPEGDPPLTVTLPTASLRANRPMTFDGAGNPSVGGPVTGATISAAMIPVVEATTVTAAMTALGPLEAHGASGAFFGNYMPPAQVSYAGDRLNLGAATAASGNYPDTTPTWVETAFPGFDVCQNTLLNAIDQYSMTAISCASRTTDSRGWAAQVPIGLAAYAWNPATGIGLAGSWAGYFDSRRGPGAGTSLGIEIDTANLGAAVPVTPWNFEPVGQTANLWLASGSGLSSGINGSSSAITILDNGAAFSIGINFASNGIAGTNGLTGLGTAIAMANNQLVGWTNSAGAYTAQIYGTTTSTANAQELLFSDGGLSLFGPSGVASVIMPPTASCDRAVTMQGAAGSGGPVISTFYNSGSGAMPLYIEPQGAGGVIFGSVIKPSSDNALTAGASGARWSAVWAANGTIQTSDPSLKTNIAPLPASLPIVMALQPKTFQWKDGGSKTVRTTVAADVPVTQVTSKTVPDHVVQPDGSVHLVERTFEKVEQVYDMVPVLNPDGSPVTDQVAQPTARGEKKVFVSKPRMHPVPRMQKGTVEKVELVPTPGKRTHWGFMAPDVKAAFEPTGLDFGGYVLGEDGTQHLRPDQLVPVLWKAVQELAAEFAAYKETHP